MGDWSLLPCDLLAHIALKLDEIEDFIYFSAVCHSWNSASLLAKPEWSPRITMPWLLLSENTKNNPDYLRKVFNPIRKRHHTLKLRQSFGARCWGSSCGWVVIYDPSLNFNLYNPLTHAQLSLPPQSTIPYEIDGEVEWLRKYFVMKVIVLRMAKDDLVVFAIHGGADMDLSYARPGDEAWTYVPPPDEFGVMDVAYWAGRIIVLTCRGSLKFLDLNGASDLQPLPDVPDARGIVDEIFTSVHKLYLVESFGDLFLVLRCKNEDAGPLESEYKTVRFEVFRLNIEEGEKLEQVNDLGDVAFFVGDNCSMSVRASDSINCRSNCIYFTDDEMQFWSWPIDLGGHDLGIFDVGTKCFETLYQGDDMHSDFCTPLWFMPELS